jgi:hypothetical protein
MTFLITVKRNGKVFRKIDTGPSTAKATVELMAALMQVLPFLYTRATYEWSCSYEAA